MKAKAYNICTKYYFTFRVAILTEANGRRRWSWRCRCSPDVFCLKQKTIIFIKGIWHFITNISYYLSYMAFRCSKSLLAVKSGDRFPVGINFSAPVRTSPESYPGFSTRDTGSYSCYLTRYTLHAKLNFATGDSFCWVKQIDCINYTPWILPFKGGGMWVYGLDWVGPG